MGVRANINGVTPTASGKTAASAAGADYPGLLAEAALHLTEAINILTYLVNDPLSGVSAESSNISTINSAITALN